MAESKSEQPGIDQPVIEPSGIEPEAASNVIEDAAAAEAASKPIEVTAAASEPIEAAADQSNSEQRTLAAIFEKVRYLQSVVDKQTGQINSQAAQINALAPNAKSSSDSEDSQESKSAAKPAVANNTLSSVSKSAKKRGSEASRSNSPPDDREPKRAAHPRTAADKRVEDIVDKIRVNIDLGQEFDNLKPDQMLDHLTKARDELEKLLERMMTRVCCREYRELTVIDVRTHVGAVTSVGDALLSDWAHVLDSMDIDKGAKSQLHLLASSCGAGYRAANSIIAKLLTKIISGEIRNMSATCMNYISNARENIKSWNYDESRFRCSPDKPFIDDAIIEHYAVSKGKGKTDWYGKGKGKGKDTGHAPARRPPPLPEGREWQCDSEWPEWLDRDRTSWHDSSSSSSWPEPCVAPAVEQSTTWWQDQSDNKWYYRKDHTEVWKLYTSK